MEKTLFEIAKGEPLKAFLKSFYKHKRNVPPGWIKRYRAQRKGLDKELAKALKGRSREKLLRLLKTYMELYKKECFYIGIRTLLELEREGKTRR